VNGVEAALRLIAGELTATRKPWALVGGLAVSARAEPRTTRDVDVVVAVPDDPAAEAFVLELRTRGFRAQAAIEQDPQGRLATVRLVTPGEPAHGTVVDLVFASSGIEAEVQIEARGYSRGRALQALFDEVLLDDA
jgi:hypothetical protein